MVDDFTMPVPSAGMPVLWYAAGVKTGRKPEVGFILNVGNRSVRLRTAFGELKETVRHVSDPKLQLNRDQREGGAWDFTDEHYHKASWTAEVDQRLRQIEARLAGNPKIPEDYKEMLEEARRLGLSFRGNPKREKLERLISEAKANVDAPAGEDLQSVDREDRGGKEGQA